ncbi:MAG: endolytic transglycosylase MltG [Alphaproteobacteria bacterium]
MEELILLSYLKVFSLFIIILLLIFFSYFALVINKKHQLQTDIVNISKLESIDYVIVKNFENSQDLNKFFFKLLYKFNLIFFNKYIHYGDFFINKEISFYNFINIITKPSNILKKITIVEGWTFDDLNKELIKHFNNFNKIPYEDILADTYFFENNNNFNQFESKLKNIKKIYFTNNKKNILFNNYTPHDLLVIGSLIEKEGLDYYDKRNISSVIFNRLKIGMKLQIDATVIYAITDGKFNLNRKLLFKDLKFDHPYNTYKYKGLPPKPITYVATETLDIILENYETDFLFYFYNNSLNKHIFSKNFKEHREKLNEYRKNK